MNRRNAIKTSLLASAASVASYNITPASDDLSPYDLEIQLTDEEVICNPLVCPHSCHIDIWFSPREGVTWKYDGFNADYLAFDVFHTANKFPHCDTVIYITPKLGNDAEFADIAIADRVFSCPNNTTITFRKKANV